VTESTGTRNSSQAYTTVESARADHFVLTPFVPDPVVAGTITQFTVFAKDRFENTDAKYVGTATLTSTDLTPTIFNPASPYTFTSGVGLDNGSKTFDVTMFKAALQTVTITDATNPLLTLTGSKTVLVVPAQIALVSVTGHPTTTVAGTANSFTVQVTDAFGNLATNYTGTVTLGSDDVQASYVPLSTSYTFTSGVGLDNGIHNFVNGATLKTVGTKFISVTDPAILILGLPLQGKQTGIVVTPAGTSKFVVSGYPTPVVAGTANTFTVSASDAFSNTTPGFTGTVNLTSSDAKGTFDFPTYTFTGAEGGTKSFQATLKIVSNSTSITATSGAQTGVQTNIVVTPAPASKVVLSGTSASVVAGNTTPLTITLFDPFDNLATNYKGTVTFSSTDPQASFPANSYTFLAGDMGTKTINPSVTLQTAGSQTIGVTGSGLTPATSPAIDVTAAGQSKFLVGGFPSPVSAGSTHPFLVTASDAFGNAITNYTGTVTLGSDDTGATFTPNGYTFLLSENGKHTFNGTLTKVGSKTITATDGAFTGNQPNISVTAGTVSKITIGGYPTSVVAGSSNGFTVTLRDQFDNVATGYAGTVTITGSDAKGTFTPTTYQFTGGDAGTKAFTGILRTAGTAAITATGTGGVGLTATQNGITVNAAATSKLVVEGFPNSVVSGTPASFTISAFDIFDNPTPGYTNTVNIASSDSAATFQPNPYTFTTGDGGKHTFTGTLRTTGVQSISVTAPGLGTATQGGITVAPVPLPPPPPPPPPVVVVPPPPPPTGPTGNPIYPIPQSYGIGSGAGGSPDVYIYDKNSNPVSQIRAFAPGFTGGARVAVADVTGDGVDDIVIGSGPGAPSLVQVVDGVTNQVIFTLQPFETSFTGGVYVSAGDITGDGTAEIVITPDQGGGPRVIVLQGQDFGQIANYIGIPDASFRGGARAAVGDINNDGFGDIAVSAGFGGGPRVTTYNGKSLAAGQVVPFNDFFIFDGPDIQNLRNGVFIAVGDINGDGFADLIAGGGPGGGPRIQIFSSKELLNGQRNVLANFFAGNINNRGGVRVVAKDLDDDEFADIVVGEGEGAGSQVTAYRGSSRNANGFDTMDAFNAFPGFNAGVYVG